MRSYILLQYFHSTEIIIIDRSFVNTLPIAVCDKLFQNKY